MTKEKKDIDRFYLLSRQVRLYWCLISFVILTTLFFPLLLISKPFSRIHYILPCGFYKLLCWFFGITVKVSGQKLETKSTLYVSNHVSWVDILTIGSVTPLRFVAKSEVSRWPVVGFLAKLQGTLFVEREKRSQSQTQKNAIAARLEAGQCILLFPEGTSTIGNSVFPFKSTLFAALDFKKEQTDTPVLVQPLTVAYTHIQGLPITDRQRPFIGWYGDMDFFPHLIDFLKLGPVVCHVVINPVLSLNDYQNRKDLAIAAQKSVSTALEEKLTACQNDGI